MNRTELSRNAIHRSEQIGCLTRLEVIESRLEVATCYEETCVEIAGSYKHETLSHNLYKCIIR